MVFVQDFKIVDRPYDEVAFRFGDGVERVLEAGLDPARAEGERLTLKIVPRGWPAVLAKAVEVRAGRVRDFEGSMIAAFSWNAPEKVSLFPRFDGDIEIAPFGLDQTAVAIRGSYEPPGRAFGERVDKLMLHRLAESTIRAFLDGLCASLECTAVR
jgi:hypothetical protein